MWKNQPSGSYWFTRGGRQFPAAIFSTESGPKFYGAMDYFAIYDATDELPVHLLAFISQSQFDQLVFSSPILVQCLIKWLYDLVVHSDGDYPYGEWYLHQNHNAFVTQRDNYLASHRNFTGLDYSLPGSDASIVDGRFASVSAFVGDADGTKTLYHYCNTLNSETLATNKTLDWLLDRNGLLGLIETSFKTVHWSVTDNSSFLWGVIEGVITELVAANPLLSYFRNYLREFLKEQL